MKSQHISTLDILFLFVLITLFYFHIPIVLSFLGSLKPTITMIDIGNWHHIDQLMYAIDYFFFLFFGHAEKVVGIFFLLTASDFCFFF